MRDPVLPEQSSDEADHGWGERPDTGGPASDDWYRSECPPHHGS